MMKFFKRQTVHATVELPDFTPKQRRVTILVARITGIERLMSSTDLSTLPEVMRHYVGGLEAAVHAHGGLLDDLRPSGAVASFGALPPARAGAGEGLRAALLIVGAAGQPPGMRARLKSCHAALDIAVGVATGDCLVGEFGSPTRAFHGCIGGAAERARVLCGAAGPGELVVDEETRSASVGVTVNATPFGEDAEGYRRYRVSAQG